MVILVIVGMFTFARPVMSQSTERLVEFRQNGKKFIITESALRHFEAEVMKCAKELEGMGKLKVNPVNINELFKSGELTPSKYISNLIEADQKFTAMLANIRAEKKDNADWLVATLSLAWVFGFITLLILISMNLNRGAYESMQKKALEEKENETNKFAHYALKRYKHLARKINHGYNPIANLERLRRLILESKFLEQLIAELFPKHVSKQKEAENLKCWFRAAEKAGINTLAITTPEPEIQPGVPETGFELKPESTTTFIAPKEADSESFQTEWKNWFKILLTLRFDKDEIPGKPQTKKIEKSPTPLKPHPILSGTPLHP
jgi:hypothetical protein